ncbi:type III secretion system export apparatus subunit SctT [Endozoicomonas sp. Mp262]|uniref:type III secretion system export apparatus subunit SctT n=1 Tax=Endozoicomonas sp. Mp262 TaxID=2919499 RepID=UPI0021D9E57F
MIELDSIKEAATAFTISLPRLMAIFIMLPVLGKKMLGGRLIRNGVVFSLAVFICPMVLGTMPDLPASISGILVTILKETAIGLIVGYCASVPFWVAEATGFLIDNQRGATMASSMNPALETQSSPLGIMLTQGLVTLFFAGGGLLILLGVVYKSYQFWPVTAFYPTFGIESVDFLISQLGLLVKLTVILAAPIIMAMFLAEFGLALISRFAPQLNVFSLSMPIKSGVGGTLLILYYSLLMSRLSEPMYNISEMVDQLLGLLSG